MIPLAQNKKLSVADLGPHLENRLFKWVYAKNNSGVALNGGLLIVQAKELVDEVN